MNLFYVIQHPDGGYIHRAWRWGSHRTPRPLRDSTRAAEICREWNQNRREEGQGEATLIPCVLAPVEIKALGNAL